jgi:signal transduction histidine kinase
VALGVDDDVVLVVVDNGGGLSDRGSSSAGLGLANLRNRAERLHGTFEITGADFGGTRLTWRVPL